MKPANDNFQIIVAPVGPPDGVYALTVPGGGFTEQDYRSAHPNRDSALREAHDLRKDSYPHALIVEIVG